MVKTLSSQRRGRRFNPWSEIPPAARLKNKTKKITASGKDCSQSMALPPNSFDFRNVPLPVSLLLHLHKVIMRIKYNSGEVLSTMSGTL